MEHTANKPVRRIPDRWSGRLGDVISWGLEVRAICFRCNHEATIDAVKLLAKFDEFEFLKHLETKFRCTKCGARMATLRWRYADEKDGTPP